MADRRALPFAVSSFRIKLNIGTFVHTGNWTKLTNTKVTWNTRPYSRGDSNIQLQLPTTKRYENVTISKPFYEEDAEMFNKIIQANAFGEFVDIFVQPIKGDGYQTRNIGGQIIISECVVVDATCLNDIDTIGDDVQTIAVTLAPGSISGQGSIIWWNEPSSLTR